MLHGPSGLLAMPGTGNKRKGRKWGMRTKAANYSAHAGETIAGNLKRGNDGKFSSGGSAPAPAARKPRKGALTPEQRQANRDQARSDKRQSVIDAMAAQDAGLSPSGSAALMAFADGGELSGANADGLAQMGMVERGADGKPRLTPAGRMAASAMNRGDARGAIDAVASGTDRAASIEAKRAAAAEKKPKGGGRGKGKKPPAPAIAKQPTPEQQAREADRANRQAATDARRQAVEQRRQARDSQRNEQQQRELTDISQRLEAGNKLSTTELQRLVTSGLAQRNGNMITMTAAGRRQARRKPGAAAKSFTVFKDAAGKLRWITRTTTAYRDRDGEIISTKALIDDAARMTRTGQYGPLRYWHIGTPNRADPARPWGPGADLGMCDFSTVIGRTSVESGTFFNEHVGRAFAATADQHEVSPGFFYSERDAQGVFPQIRRFERSPVPIAYGRASNYFTGVAVKEHHMDPQEVTRRLKAMQETLGLSPDQLVALAGDIATAEKSATDQQIAFKSDDAPAVYAAPDGALGMIVGGRFVALKAATMPPAVAMPPMEEDKAAGDELIEDPAMEGTPEDNAADAGEYMGDMNVADFEAMLTGAIQAALAPLVKGLDISGKLAGHVDELKGMMGGVATKDNARAVEIAALKERLAALEGDQPAAQPLPTNADGDIAAALKGGPRETPADGAVNVPNDPSRPLASVAAQTFPQLYGVTPQGTFNGWASPPPLNS